MMRRIDQGNNLATKRNVSALKVEQGATPCVEKINVGKWSPGEHGVFQRSFLLHGKDWHAISKRIRTRTPTQVRTHAQKYLLKIQKHAIRKETSLLASDRAILERLKDSKLDLRATLLASQTINQCARSVSEDSVQTATRAEDQDLEEHIRAVSSLSARQPPNIWDGPSCSLPRAMTSPESSVRIDAWPRSPSKREKSLVRYASASTTLEDAYHLFNSLLPLPDDMSIKEEARVSSEGESHATTCPHGATNGVQADNAKSRHKGVEKNGHCSTRLQRHSCSYEGCNKTFASREGLTLHRRNQHEDFKPWQCPCRGCSDAFVRKNDLRLHLVRCHLSANLYRCTIPLCNRECISRSELRRHFRSKHTMKHFEMKHYSVNCSTLNALNEYMTKAENRQRPTYKKRRDIS